MSLHEPGSVSDVTMVRDRLDVHTAVLAKDGNNGAFNDIGELFHGFPNSWAVLVDKVYIGLTSAVRAIHPKKKPVNGLFYRVDLDRNANVLSDGVIVENFFGRVCLLRKISNSTFVWGTKLNDAIQRLAFALTNFHVFTMPLRQDDHHQYRSVLARYKRMVDDNKSKRAAAALWKDWLIEIRRQVRIRNATNLKLRCLSRSAMVSWITGTWNNLPQSVILNGFRKCQLIAGAIEENGNMEGSLDDHELKDLMKEMAIKYTILLR
ncbi:hypothetical protein DYB25_010342 [Aphanomyces astaci]|uniref:DDE Tnp4 domain-containing protein n=1 Tax=Aphanomyces astaci TaxID=112090 RepID=A0A397BBU4_APHAT|nr:hypothetical protein DYB25_010342 [Aphanomyces astaci]RHY42041.1 hypothetical protein DYB38_002887 [Aphanomyces astaci]RHY47047.1 hypothetical protein DYB34_011077 [Aphanomyces astaci]RHY60073.1 hypothetical protein DYB30_004158 [Aphanomyces astaci]RHY88315.1 hypothetical protein DYB26_001168 [Aphanomyces astaci]